MNASAPTIRQLASITGLALVAAALAVPTALARQATVDGDTMTRTVGVANLRSPDTADAAAKLSAPGLDPAIATAIAAHERQLVSNDRRSPDTRDVVASPAVQVPVAVAAPVPSDEFDWSRLAIVLAAVGAIVVGVGSVARQSGKGTRSVTTS